MTEAASAMAAKEFFAWVYANGDEAAKKLDYVPLPPDVVKAVEASWKDIKDASGKAVLN